MDILKVKINNEWVGIPAIEGAPGEDGYSPTASVSKSGATSTITITDKNGTTTAQVQDGDDYILTAADKQEIAGMVDAPVTSVNGQTGAVTIAVPAIDDTLTQAGEAADAKKTGDEIAELKDEAVNAYATDTASGAIASFSDGAGGIPVKDLTVTIEAVQSGTGDPSPSNIRPISGWTGVNVTRAGKNLIRCSEGTCYDMYAEGGSLRVNYNGDNVELEKIGDSFEYGYAIWQGVDIVQAMAGKTVCFSANNIISGDYIYCIKNGNRSILGTTSGIITEQHVGGKLAIRLYIGQNQGVSRIINDIQLEFSNSATAYAPYVAPSVTSLTFPTPPGTVYGGTLDVTTGVLTVEWIKQPANALSTWYNSAYSSIGVFYAQLLMESNYSQGNNFISNKYKTIESSTSQGEMDDFSIKGNAYNGGYVYVRDSRYANNLSEFRQNLDFDIVYELATPQTYQLTPVEVGQLFGYNNIYADTGNGTVVYRKAAQKPPVQDVQVNGMSILNNGVANVPIGNTSDYGAIKLANTSFGLEQSSAATGNLLRTCPASSNDIKTGNQGYRPITPANQHLATFYGLAKAAGSDENNSANAVGTYTDAAKAAILSMIGAETQITVSGTTPTITANRNELHVCGEVATLSFTPCVTGCCGVIFESGSTATVLTVPSTVKWPDWFDPTSLDANVTYEISILNGILGVVTSWA